MSIPPFDLLSAPLAGRTLIEASAGTGKTYTIAALFVRLLVERGLEVEQILVVTYTEAATAELRERVRRRIGEAVAVFAGAAEDADFLSPLRERVSDRTAALCRLRRALIAFDQAAIHTIHGFCQRVLRDRAFEARALFDTELVTDLSALEEELADDFWRRRSATFPPALVDFLLTKNFGPDLLVTLLRTARRPERILPEIAPPDLTRSEEACRALRERLRALWQGERGAIVDGVRQALPGLNGTSYSEERLVLWERELEEFFSGETLWGAEKALERLGTFVVKKGGGAPSHPFHPLCADFYAARAEFGEACAATLLALQREFLLWAGEEMARRKARNNVRTFDDLLLEVQRAIAAEGGSGLLAALRRTFRAVLIDEFQDTDPVQYAIFHALCPDAGSTLFLIGDPKQAIYAFRGADIFTYLAATRQVEQRYTLGVNRRSAPALVRGVNALFTRANPFLFSEIPYPAVAPDLKNNAELALLDGDRAATALQLWQVPRAEEKAAKKGDATAAIVAAVTGEIVRLLASGARLRLQGGEERPLAAGDIAVLVRTNPQAAQMVASLQAAGVAGVRNGSESLFVSREAIELHWVLQALAAPGNLALVRAALATAFFGWDATRLAASVEAPEAFEPWLERLRHYHTLWSQRGVTALSGALLAQEGMPARLLALPDGERRLTNLRHAFEVLQRAESEEGLGVEGLLKWFSRHIAAPPLGEEYQLRLETDARAVQVVTIHRSKGLEYPVCFVPFCWNPSSGGKGPFHFHLAAADDERGPLCLDLGSPADERERYLALCEREALSENLRLFYVALTRAKVACYLVWGGLKDAATAAPNWLLHAPADVPAGAELAACAARFKELDDAAIRSRLALLAQQDGVALAELPGGTDTVLTVPEEETAALLPPPLLQPVRSLWRLTSYSALAAGAHHPAEGEGWLRAERGEHGAAPAEDEGGRTVHDFPAGAEAGSCLHDILEAVDFTATDGEVWRPLIAATLERYRIDLDWVPVVQTLLERLFATPLDPAVPGLRLRTVGWGERCSEMGFFLPLAPFDVAQLTEVFARHRDRLPEPQLPEVLAQLTFGTVAGMLRGFIDLVFVHAGRYYLIDWKSNRLGRSASDYDRAAMGAEMLATGYLLQYHLYCVALHRHLQRTVAGYDYARHFGGVCYLFLRGIDPAAGDYGIYRDCPDQGLIEELDRLLGP